MKKLKFLFSSLLAIGTYYSGYTQVTAKESTATFGRYGNDCSNGRGICAFNVQQAPVNTNTAKSSQKISDNTFVFKISRKNLTVQDEIRIAGKAFSDILTGEKILFQQIDTISLDKNTVGNLGFPASLNKIAVGEYPIIIYSDRIEITFTVTP